MLLICQQNTAVWCFGQFDEYAKAIESNLNIELIARDGVVKIIGAEANVIRARRCA